VKCTVVQQSVLHYSKIYHSVVKYTFSEVKNTNFGKGIENYPILDIGTMQTTLL